jgi:phosphoribosyl 1,2-cyclic phosphodiesterase
MGFMFCPLFSGSSGNASIVCAGDTRILVDCGLTGSTIVAALENVGIDPRTLDGILITHEHSDHINGAGVISRKFNLPIYANQPTWLAMENGLGAIAARNIRMFSTGCDFYIGDINVSPFLIPHDAAEPVGYSIFYHGHKLTIMTDIGYARDSLHEAAEGSQMLLIESNHDVDMLKQGPYSYALKKRILGQRGHLSNDDAGLMLVKLNRLGVKRAALGHLSRENNREPLALNTVSNILKTHGIMPERDMQLYMTHRDRAAGIFVLE